MKIIIESKGIFISAVKKINIEELRNVITSRVRDIHLKRYPNKKNEE